MATTVRIRLEGGPCAGRTTTVQRTGDLLPGVTCKGANYQPTERVGASGRVIYTTTASQDAGGDSGSGSGTMPAKAHTAWHTMIHTAFVRVPHELHKSAQAREAIRQLGHRKGLR